MTRYFKMFIIKWYQLSQNQIINLTWFDYVQSDLRWKLLINVYRPGTIARMFIHCNDEIHFSRSGLAVSHSKYKRCTTTQRRRNTLDTLKRWYTILQFAKCMHWHQCLLHSVWWCCEIHELKGMETFRGQWHDNDTFLQNGQLLVDILKGWLFVDTFGDISWTLLVKWTLFSVRSGGAGAKPLLG
jgi:hypothetical protein